MDEWAGRQDVRLSTEIAAETLVVRGITDEEIEPLIPILFDAEKVEGRWVRDDREAIAAWRRARQQSLVDQAKKRGPGAPESWADEWRANAGDYYFNRNRGSVHLADSLTDAFLASETSWAKELADESPTSDTGIRAFKLPQEVRTAASETLREVQRIPLSDSTSDQMFRANYAWTQSPDSALIAFQWMGNVLSLGITYWATDMYLGGTFRTFTLSMPEETGAEEGARFDAPGLREDYSDLAFDSGRPLGYLTEQIYPDENRLAAVLSGSLESEFLNAWGKDSVNADSAIEHAGNTGFGFKTARANETLLLKPSNWACHVAYRLNAKAVNEFSLGIHEDATHAPYLRLVVQAGKTFGRHPWMSKWREENYGCATIGSHSDAEFLAWTYPQLVPAGTANLAARRMLLDELGGPGVLSPRLQAAVRRGQFSGVSITFPRERKEVLRFFFATGEKSPWNLLATWQRTASGLLEGTFERETTVLNVGAMKVSDGDVTATGETVLLP